MDHRQAAQNHLDTLLTHLGAQPASAQRDGLVEECQSLAIAIRAFHMEAIRFRMFNVDRLLKQYELPAGAQEAFASVRRELEAAGFHTRSHQAPS